MRLAGTFDVALKLLASLFLLVTEAREALTPRYLVYPPPTSTTPTKVQLIFGLGIPMEVEVSTIVGYVMKCNYNLPYNASYLSESSYLRYQRSTSDDGERLINAEWKGRHESGSEDLGIERYEIYKMLETAIDSRRNSGKACLLRAICELAATPLNDHDGLTAQLLNIFLKPSSTLENFIDSSDQEYMSAEQIGLTRGEDCSRIFNECNINILDYFSKISS